MVLADSRLCFYRSNFSRHFWQLYDFHLFNQKCQYFPYAKTSQETFKSQQLQRCEVETSSFLEKSDLEYFCGDEMIF